MLLRVLLFLFFGVLNSQTIDEILDIEDNIGQQELLNEDISENIISLVTVSSGVTLEKAIENGLRKSIESTFGIFISTSTEIVNDKIRSDVIKTLSFGKILEYKVLSQKKIENYFIIKIKSKILKDELKKEFKERNVSIKYDFNLFNFNLKLIDYYRNNELSIVEDFIKYDLKKIKTYFDYEISVGGNPRKNSSYNDVWRIPIEISLIPNMNYSFFIERLETLLVNLSMSDKEKSEYKNIGYKVNHINLNGKDYFLRNYKSLREVIHLIHKIRWGLLDFYVKDGNRKYKVYDKSLDKEYFYGGKSSKYLIKNINFFNEPIMIHEKPGTYDMRCYPVIRRITYPKKYFSCIELESLFSRGESKSNDSWIINLDQKIDFGKITFDDDMSKEDLYKIKEYSIETF